MIGEYRLEKRNTSISKYYIICVAHRNLTMCELINVNWMHSNLKMCVFYIILPFLLSCYDIIATVHRLKRFNCSWCLDASKARVKLFHAFTIPVKQLKIKLFKPCQFYVRASQIKKAVHHSFNSSQTGKY